MHSWHVAVQYIMIYHRVATKKLGPSSEVVLTKDIPNIALSGKLLGVCRPLIADNLNIMDTHGETL